MIFILLIVSGIVLLIVASFLDTGAVLSDDILLGLAITLAGGGAVGGLTYVLTEASWSHLLYILLVVGAGVGISLLAVPPLKRLARSESVATPFRSQELVWNEGSVVWWNAGRGSVDVVVRDNHVTLPATGPADLRGGQKVYVVSADDTPDGVANLVVDTFDPSQGESCP